MLSLTALDPLVISTGSRSSPLSRAQVKEILEELQEFHPHISFNSTYLETSGDNDRTISLRTLGKTNFFTKEIDHLLLSNEVRIAIHSAKDLPEPLPNGLHLVALTKGIDSSDSLVLRRGATLQTLRQHAVIATSSERRENSVRMLRNDFEFIDVRGTIQERLQLLETGQADGVVIAEAAIIRLDLQHLNRISLPGPTSGLQGQLAIVARADDEEMARIFSCIDSRPKLKRALYLGLNSTTFYYPGKITHYPVIRIEAFPASTPEIQTAFREFDSYTHIIFTSKSTVKIFFSLLKEYKIYPRSLIDKEIIAIGIATEAALENNGLRINTVPEMETAEGLIACLEKQNLSKAHILYPHSQQSRSVLADFFEHKNIRIRDLVLYRPVYQQPHPIPSLENFDCIVFTSPSTVDGFLKIYPEIPWNKDIRAIGPITRDYLEKTKLFSLSK